MIKNKARNNKKWLSSVRNVVQPILLNMAQQYETDRKFNAIYVMPAISLQQRCSMSKIQSREDHHSKTGARAGN